MEPVTGTAPGKIILFGEHAVVYGQPALAVPVTDVRAQVSIMRGAAGTGLRFEAPQLDESFLASENPDSPLAVMARITLEHLHKAQPDAAATVTSTVPMAGGMGSGAAVATALGRALAHYFGMEIEASELSELVHEVEKLHHGTPSGLDNTTICYGQPVYFVRGTTPEILNVSHEFHLIVGDTGVPSATKNMVDGVRQRRTANKEQFDHIFASVGAIVRSARVAIEQGEIASLGGLMHQNHALLQKMGVSSPELDRLVSAAEAAGADGAKLSGGGGGGNMIALATAERAEAVRAALEGAGAARTIHTVVHTTKA